MIKYRLGCSDCHGTGLIAHNNTLEPCFCTMTWRQIKKWCKEKGFWPYVPEKWEKYLKQ